MYLCVERSLHKFVNCYFYMQCLATKIVSNIEQNFPLACEKFCMTLPLCFVALQLSSIDYCYTNIHVCTYVFICKCTRGTFINKLLHFVAQNLFNIVLLISIEELFIKSIGTWTLEPRNICTFVFYSHFMSISWNFLFSACLTKCTVCPPTSPGHAPTAQFYYY